MIAGVKKCIDAGDIKGLRYIFLDSLDVDPTFEKYKDDYAICRKIEGMFEPYAELTALSTNHSEWDMDYWVKLKYDQKQNFSEKRFGHMIEVAKVVNAEKVERLLAERAAKQSKIEEQIEQVIPKETVQPAKPQQSQGNNIQQTKLIQSKQQVIQSKSTVLEENISVSDRTRINESKRDIDLHNQRVEQERLENERKRVERAKEIERQNALVESKNQPKKATGIVAVAVVIILIVVVVLLLKVL